MKKEGLSFQEHYEIGRNLRMIKSQIRSVANTLSTKCGATKKFTRTSTKICEKVDKLTDEMSEFFHMQPDLPPDHDNYYYKV